MRILLAGMPTALRKASSASRRHDRQRLVPQDEFMSKVSKSAKKLALVNEDAKASDTAPAKVGSARGIESMYRNSYRAQLDMITLAATKANIIISLNGLLISMLILSGAYLLQNHRLFLVPVIILILTCTTAVSFAVLAARPERRSGTPTAQDFNSDNGMLLLFDQFAALSCEEYVESMRDMMQSNDRVYANMSAHIYALGCIADRKFSRLYISYNVFIIGLILSVAAMIGVFAILASGGATL